MYNLTRLQNHLERVGDTYTIQDRRENFKAMLLALCRQANDLDIDLECCLEEVLRECKVEPTRSNHLREGQEHS